MRIAVPNQIAGNETRVALTPDSAGKLAAGGCEVAVESGAGQGAFHPDEAYSEAGATIVPSGESDSLWSDSDMVLAIASPTAQQAGKMKAGAILAGILSPLDHLDVMKTLADREVTTFALEFLPRISRAQSMDVLSSQANIGGYKAVILAAEHCPKLFPMMTTAAGTIAPSRVFVIGAGVAGLQAIATAKRLGAIVEAYDVRAATKEQVQSLGGRFVELTKQKQDDAATGGYAKEQSEAERQQQIELMTKHVTGADCVITTAALFGKAPPMLVPGEMVGKMKRGAVIVDLAASEIHGRGNCEATKPGEIIATDNGVTVVGLTNLPGLLPIHASQMLSANIANFIDAITNEGKAVIDLEDELQVGALMTHGGEIVNEMVKDKMA